MGNKLEIILKIMIIMIVTIILIRAVWVAACRSSKGELFPSSSPPLLYSGEPASTSWSSSWSSSLSSSPSPKSSSSSWSSSSRLPSHRQYPLHQPNLNYHDSSSQPSRIPMPCAVPERKMGEPPVYFVTANANIKIHSESISSKDLLFRLCTKRNIFKVRLEMWA